MVSKDSEGYPEQLCATEEISELACPNLYLNREINWLDFDAKVLDEATDAGLPLLEQLGRAQQHGGVTVVPAGVAVAVVCGWRTSIASTAAGPCPRRRTA